MPGSNKLIPILRMARLHFLFGGFILFLLGCLLAFSAGSDFSLAKFLLGYTILFTAQLSVSYSNDYYDYNTDKNEKRTLFSGGSGVLIENPELRPFARFFAIFLIGLSLWLALVFLVIFSFPLTFLAFVVMGNLIGWFYSAPPAKFVYRGGGELATMITAGFMLPGMGFFVLRGTFDYTFFLFLVPLMLYGLAFIVNVEIPDMESDRLGNKHNIIVKKGRKFGFYISALVISLATIYFLTISAINPEIGVDFRIITFFSLIPLAIGLFALYRHPEERKKATKHVTATITSFILFVLMIDCYLLIAV